MPNDPNWPFVEPKNVAVFTTAQVIKSGKSIALVTHDAEDGAWQFRANDSSPDETPMVLALSEVFDLDPTIGELADLPLGWKAVRNSRTSAWKRFRQTDGEIFDVVNERDEVVGQNTRSEVHRLGLKHRAIHVLVFNGRGEVFLQKRSMAKDTFPGAWDSSVSGHVDAGEDYDASAMRELREEIGLKVDHPPQRLFKLEARAETGCEFVWIYRCEAEGPFTLHPEEIETGGWFTPEKVTRWMAERPGDFASALLFLWKRLK